MPAPSLYQRIISGEAGPWATPIRAALCGGEVLYRAGVAVRNRRFDRRGADVTLSVPVISVGNITAGGTGKTPLVIDLVARLDRMGKSPAVVSRGYGSPAGEPNDEERLVRRHCPAVSYFANPDRAAAAEEACLRCGADVIVLDDGFQHRRLARALAFSNLRNNIFQTCSIYLNCFLKTSYKGSIFINYTIASKCIFKSV